MGQAWVDRPLGQPVGGLASQRPRDIAPARDLDYDGPETARSGADANSGGDGRPTHPALAGDHQEPSTSHPVVFVGRHVSKPGANN